MNPSLFEKYGDKALTLATVGFLYLQGRPELFPDFNAPAICGWCAFFAAMGTLSHRLFFPDAPQDIPTLLRRLPKEQVVRYARMMYPDPNQQQQTQYRPQPYSQPHTIPNQSEK